MSRAARQWVQSARTVAKEERDTADSILARLREERRKHGFRGRTHKKLGKERRVVMAISDVHRPRHDPATWAIFLQAVRDIRPDSIWLLGDFVDMISANSHESMADDREWTLQAEFADANRALDQLSDAIGNRAMNELLFVDGNHEHRWKRMRGRGQIPAAFRDIFSDLPEELWLARRGYTYVSPEAQPYRAFREFWVHHGHWYGENHARQHQLRLAVSSIYGHTHRAQVVYSFNARGPIITVGMPCARDPNAEWRHPPSQPFNGWTTGFGVADVIDGFPWWNLVMVQEGKAAYGGRVWRAK